MDEGGTLDVTPTRSQVYHDKGTGGAGTNTACAALLVSPRLCSLALQSSVPRVYVQCETRLPARG